MILQDLEEIEEWNEYGELRMVVNSVEDFDSMPATSYPAPAAQTGTESAASTPTPESAAPKQSTIKIQNPPAKETQKDDSITVALRQAGEEAASKAKENSAKPEKAPAATGEPSAQPTAGADTEKKMEEEDGEDSGRRKSVVPEDVKRPPLIVPEIAAVSSANIHADKAQALGLVEHHRGSIVSATSPEEQEKVKQDLRKSISGGRQEILESLKKEKEEQGAQDGPIEEEPAIEDEPDVKDTEAKKQE